MNPLGGLMKEHHSCSEAIHRCIEEKTFTIAHLYREDKLMDMHIHDCYELYYSVSGGKQFLIGGRLYDMAPGDIFVINQYESHYLTPVGKEPPERIVLSIYPEYMKQISSEKTNLDELFSQHPQDFSHRLSLTLEQQNRVLYFINKILSAGNGFGSDRIEESAFVELMVLLNRLYRTCGETLEHEGEEQPHYNPYVSKTIAYINEHIQDDLSIENLAAYFHLSESYICRIFRAATGTTINKYVTARRISMAKALLASGTSVGQVCEECGFRDYSNFLKAFTKTVGLSPKKYATLSTR